MATSTLRESWDRVPRRKTATPHSNRMAAGSRRSQRSRGKRGKISSMPNWKRKKKERASRSRWAMTIRRTTASSKYRAWKGIKI